MRFLKPILKSLVIAGTLTTIIGGTLYTRIEGTTLDLDRLKIKPHPTEIYDANGQILARFYDNGKDQTDYKDIPPEIVQAVISTEDREFFEHPGVNVKALARAGVAVAKSGGEFVQGGSTITQQLIKKMYLHDGKTIARKAEEMVYATILEQHMPKEEIIENYLNHIFYGNQAYGIKDAIRTYFGQTIEEFNKDTRINRITKAALLGGLPQSPSALDPYLHPEKAKIRRDTVLLNLRNVGYITQEEFDQAIKLPFLILPKPQVVNEDEKNLNPEYTHLVLQEAAKELKTDINEVRFSGLKIYTAYNPEVYKILRDKFNQAKYFPENASDGKQVDGAGAFVNPKNGEILAFTGGRNVPKFLDYNPAFQMYRQPGSTFKPIVSYGPALESGKFTPWSSLVDIKGYDFGGYAPKDWDNGGRGRVTMMEAIAKSWNIPAVWTLQQVGIPYATEYVKRLGIELTPEDKYLPIALGGLDKGVTPIQLADAYQAFANGGYRIPSHTIRKVVNDFGETVVQNPTEVSEKYRVIQQQNADYMKMMLRGVVDGGLASKIEIDGQFLAGKTGTTEYPGTKGNRDIWFAGFNQNYIGVIWMGFPQTDDKHYLHVSSSVPTTMFGDIAKDMVKSFSDPIENYVKPERGAKVSYKEMKIDGSFNEATKKATISWQKQPDLVYTVYRDGKIIGSTNKDKFEDDKAEGGKSYEYQVTAATETSKFKTHESNTVVINVPYQKAPGYVKVFGALKATDTTITLNWDTVQYADSYEVKRDGAIIYTGSNDTIIDRELEPNKQYTYEIAAKNQYGLSPSVKTIIKTKEKAPEQPIQPVQPVQPTVPPAQTNNQGNPSTPHQ